MADWRSIDSAPMDENILVAAAPDWVGEARLDVEYPNGEYALVWKWADGSALHANHVPTHWMHKPKHPDLAIDGEQYKSWEQVSAGAADSHTANLDEALCLECQGGQCTAAGKCEAMTNQEPRRAGVMRAQFAEWVQDRGCDTDGAWSAWQGCWNLFAGRSPAESQVEPLHLANDAYERRMKWLHSPKSSDVDGYEWGIYRVKYENGQRVECWQTLGDFSDLDAAIARSESGTVSGADAKACPSCEVGLIGDAPDTQQVCPDCDGAGSAHPAINRAQEQS